MSFAEKIQAVPTLTHMGLEAIEDGPNCMHVKMPAKGNSNHFGAVYAGAIFSLAEFPMGMLFGNRFGFDEFFPVVGEMSVRYTAPAFSDLYVKMEMTEDEWNAIAEGTRANGKYRLQRETPVTDEQGNVVAVATATYFSVLRNPV